MHVDDVTRILYLVTRSDSAVDDYSANQWCPSQKPRDLGHKLGLLESRMIFIKAPIDVIRLYI